MWRLQTFRYNLLTGDGEVVSLTRFRPSPTGIFLALISVRNGVDLLATLRLDWMGKLKIVLTYSGLDPASFLPVARCLHQLRYRAPLHCLLFLLVIHLSVIGCSSDINQCSCVRLEVFTAVTTKNAVFWDVTPCGSCKNRRFGGT
jgi:hypothetical protein